MSTQALIKDYLLVHVENAWFDIDGILDRIVSGKIDEYDCLSDRLTLMRKQYRSSSFLYHGLGEMISYSEERDGWFKGTWYNKKFPDSEFASDSIFFDEFLFLTAEGLIEFSDVEFLTDDEIWQRASAYFDSLDQKKYENTYLADLYKAKDLKSLLTAYRTLLKEYHPDKVGSSGTERTREIIVTYTKLLKKFK